MHATCSSSPGAQEQVKAAFLVSDGVLDGVELMVFCLVGCFVI